MEKVCIRCKSRFIQRAIDMLSHCSIECLMESVDEINADHKAQNKILGIPSTEGLPVPGCNLACCKSADGI